MPQGGVSFVTRPSCLKRPPLRQAQERRVEGLDGIAVQPRGLRHEGAVSKYEAPIQHFVSILSGLLKAPR